MTLHPTIEDFVVLAFEIPGYTFHIMMAIFILVQIKRHNAKFDSAFFIIFVSICFADIGYYFICSVMSLKLPQFGLWTNFYVNTSDGWMSTIGYMTGEYFHFYQPLAHTLISLNRFNVFYWKLKYDKIWTRSHVLKAIVFMALVPLVLMSRQFASRTKVYLVMPNENQIVQQMRNRYVQLTVSILGLTTYMLTMTIELTLGIITSVRYRNLSREGTITREQQYASVLLIHSICLTFAQVLRTVFHASVIIANLTNNTTLASIMQKRLPVFADIYALVGSIFLFIISREVRHSFLRFYGCRSFFGRYVGPMSTQRSHPGIHSTSKGVSTVDILTVNKRSSTAHVFLS